MKYSHIISDMVWSYSRINSFDCPYKWYLVYIEGVEKERKFFSDYGTFAHKLLQMYLSGETSKEELLPIYLSQFRRNVIGKAPNRKIYTNYFQSGVSYFSDLNFPTGYKILGTEVEVNFPVGGIPFTGFLDVVAEDEDGLVIIDHKSRNLKPRSTRQKPTKTDEELDHYLRQLYLYSIAVKQDFGEYPKKLAFNCFREGLIILEPFSEEKLSQTEGWAGNMIERITQECDWKPKIDCFFCENLCDVSNKCEFYNLSK